MLTEEQLKTIHDMASSEIDSARKQMEQDGYVTARYLLFGHTPEGKLNVKALLVPAIRDTQPGKGRDVIGESIRLQAKAMNATAAFSVLEVWLRLGTIDNQPPPITPGWSKAADAREAVVATLQVHNEASAAVMPIIREHGKPATFTAEPQWKTGAKASGRLLAILPDPPERDPIKTGDRVFVTFQKRTLRARVALASPNGRSLMLEFDGMLGGYLGLMPVSREPSDPEYRDLLMGEPVTITTETDHADH